MQAQVGTTNRPTHNGRVGRHKRQSSRPRTAKHLSNFWPGFLGVSRLLSALHVCYPHIIPVDEVVCLKQFHRDDEPLMRLFLDDAQKRRLDRLWEEHRFVSQWPISENKYLPLFIGFVTQDNPKALVTYFEAKREPFRLRASNSLSRSFKTRFHCNWSVCSRSPNGRIATRLSILAGKDRIADLYHAIRNKGAGHEEAFRGVLTRAGFALLPVPDRTIARRANSRNRRRLGIRHPAELFPLVHDARWAS